MFANWVSGQRRLRSRVGRNTHFCSPELQFLGVRIALKRIDGLVGRPWDVFTNPFHHHLPSPWGFYTNSVFKIVPFSSRFNLGNAQSPRPYLLQETTILKGFAIDIERQTYLHSLPRSSLSSRGQHEDGTESGSNTKVSLIDRNMIFFLITFEVYEWPID